MTQNLKNMKPEDLNEYLFLQYKSGDRGRWATTSVNAKAFFRGLQWDETDAQALEANNQPALTDNEVTPAIELLISNLCENQPRFQVAGRENSDSKVASDVADFISWLWDKSDGNEKVEESVIDWECTGMAGFHAYVDAHGDNGKPAVCFYAINPLELYIDPNSKREDTEDAAHKLIVCRKTREEIENWLPEFDFKDAQQAYETDEPITDKHASQDEVLSVDDFTHEKYRVIDRYTKIKDKRYKVTDSTNGFEKVFTKDEYIAYANEPAVVLVKNGKEMYVTEKMVVKKWLGILEQYGEIIHFMSDESIMSGVEHSYVSPQGTLPLPGSTTMIKSTNKIELLNLGIIKYEQVFIDRIRRVLTVGKKLIYNSVMPVSKYPIITFQLHHNRNPFPQGDITLVKPLQEQLNKFNSLMVTYFTNITNIKVFVPDGTDLKPLEENLGKAGTQIFVYDPEFGTPIVLQIPPLPSGFFQERQNIISQIQRILGSYSFQDGDQSQAPQTFGGTLTIEENMQKRIRFKRKKIERAINRLAQVMMQMIPNVYPEEKVIRIIRPNHDVKEIKFNVQEGNQIINDLSVEYDVIMVAGSMLGTNRQARAQALLDLYREKVLQDKSLIIEQLDLPNISEILERENMITQAQQVIQQLQEQVKQLSGQLQTKSREVIQANEKVIVEKFKTSTDKIKNRGEVAVMLASQRLNDLTKETKQKKKENVKKVS